MPKRRVSDDSLAPEPKVVANLPWPDIPGIKTEEEVNSDRTQSEYRKMVNILRTMTKFTPAPPTIIEPDIRDIPQMLTDPVVSGRSFTLKRWYHKGGKYQWEVVDNSSTPFFSAKTKTLSIASAFMQGHEDFGRRIGEKIIDVFRRWSTPWSDGPGSKSAAMVVRVCYSMIVHNNARVYVPRPRVKSRRQDETEYIVSVSYFDRISGQRNNIDIVTTPDVVAVADIPPLPEYVRFYDTDRGGFSPIDQVADQDGVLHWPSIVPANLPDRSSRANHEKAVKYYEYMAYVFTDTIATDAEIKKARDMHARSFGTDRKARRGVYRGEPMLILSERNHRLEISASKAVRDDLGGVVPRVLIQSPNTARALAAMNAATACYLETGDVRRALLVLAESADIINREIRAGQPPDNACSCDNNMKKTTLHACGKCGELAICESRQQDWRGCWICLFCQMRASAAPARNLVSEILERSLNNLFRHDCKKLDLNPDAPEQQEAYNQALEDLERYVKSSTSYYDEYRSKTVILATNEHLEGSTKYSPDLPSVDGIFSFYESDGKLRYHCKGNIAVTSVALNYLKATHNPALLSHISEFSRSLKTKADRTRVLKKVTNSALIRLKVPYKIRARLKRPLNKSQFRNDLNEWVSDRLAPSKAGVFSTSRLRIGSIRKKITLKPWNASDRQRLLKIVRQIEKRFGVSLPRSAIDDCPWFGLEEAMPEKWSWVMCFDMVADRLQRMRFWCNRYWKTVDTIDTFFLEIMYQACDPVYADFLGLPLVAWERHPFCISIAHKIHKRQMRTGWTTANPDSLSQRDDSLNNILIETQASNYLKHDFDPSAYPRLLQMVKEISISRTLHDSDLDCELWEDEEITKLAELGVDSAVFEGIVFEDAFE